MVEVENRQVDDLAQRVDALVTSRYLKGPVSCKGYVESTARQTRTGKRTAVLKPGLFFRRPYTLCAGAICSS